MVDGAKDDSGTTQCFHAACSEDADKCVRRRDCFITRGHCKEHARERLSRGPEFVEGRWRDVSK